MGVLAFIRREQPTGKPHLNQVFIRCQLSFERFRFVPSTNFFANDFKRMSLQLSCMMRIVKLKIETPTDTNSEMKNLSQYTTTRASDWSVRFKKSGVSPT